MSNYIIVKNRYGMTDDTDWRVHPFTMQPHQRRRYEDARFVAVASDGSHMICDGVYEGLTK